MLRRPLIKRTLVDMITSGKWYTRLSPNRKKAGKVRLPVWVHALTGRKSGSDLNSKVDEFTELSSVISLHVFLFLISV